MKFNFPISIALFSSFFFFACAESDTPPASETEVTVNHFDTLKHWMTGSFNSSLQAQNDSDYYDISLEMHEVWKEDPSTWIYVEQALSSAKDRPYRQRVYRLDQEDSIYQSFIYEFNDPSIYTGQWNNDSLWSAITPDSVLLKEGCEVSLLWDEANHVFAGATDSATCMSTLRGASFATSIVTVYPEAINSWDRGFDSTGAYVWGAEKAGYEFIRQE